MSLELLPKNITNVYAKQCIQHYVNLMVTGKESPLCHNE